VIGVGSRGTPRLLVGTCLESWRRNAEATTPLSNQDPLVLFNSLIFLYFFLPITYCVFWLLRNKEHRYLWLTLTGYVFYGTWNYKFCALMAFSTLVSYLAGLGLLTWSDPLRRRLCLVVPVTIDLLLLGFFKYANFALGSAGSAASWLGISLRLPALDIVLPVGISFYTFHTITYIVDSYRGTIKPTRNLFEFSCYVSLFSQLVAGPIVRFRQVERDLENIDQANRTAYLNLGWSFFVLGMIKKVLIADTIAAMINPPLKDYAHLSTVASWMCMLGYTYQLYFDFSGYSDMAVGLGYLFGIRLPQNFNSPYKSVDVADFWRRWHMSLSSCLRDYLYIPLGGSRGPEWQTYRNLLITMLIGGLWHGANWTFVCWGGYHGLLLMAHRAGGRYWDALPRHFRQISTFLLVMIGWVFFRSDDFTMARTLFHSMFLGSGGLTMPWTASLSGMLLLAGVIAHWLPNTFELTHEWRWWQALGLGCLFVLCLFVIYGGDSSPFLYFQF
jgi:alginate O-acetyltransferase complex protein AlgI